LRKLFARLDPDQLDRILGAWLWTRSDVVHGQRVIALDGKTVRGARTVTTSAPHLVAALDHTTAVVVGQVQVAAKSNEIPAVRDLLAGFDLAGVVVTVDAMHTQTDTGLHVTAITSAGGDYVFTVKGNTPTLHRQLKALPWTDVPAHSATLLSHGRRATRTIKSRTAPTWIGFAGAAQVAQIRRTVTRAGKKSIEVVYLITSANHTPHHQPPWPRGSKATGASKTACTGSRRLLRRRPLPSPHQTYAPGSWPPCATPRSASCA